MNFPAIALSSGALGIVACASVPREQQMPDNAFITDPGEIPFLFRQCSRPSPTFVASSYRLETRDILALERALPSALSEHLQKAGYGSGMVTFQPSSYRRHYAAYEAGGRAMIYGSFAPLSVGPGRNGPASPVMVCDGGPSFFGAEFDVTSQQITRLSFNGGFGPVPSPIEP